MATEQTKERQDSVQLPNGTEPEESFQDGPDGWKFRFVRGNKPKLLRLMATSAFRDALRESLGQTPSREEAT